MVVGCLRNQGRQVLQDHPAVLNAVCDVMYKRQLLMEAPQHAKATHIATCTNE
jgi:hypothetical protein